MAQRRFAASGHRTAEATGLRAIQRREAGIRLALEPLNRSQGVASQRDDRWIEWAVTFQASELDAKGRRIKKVVSNSGNSDGTVVYIFDGSKICETRDGSNNMVQQFIHGTQYIDELVMVRAKDKGDLYIHQDANWNVIATTDLATNVVERYDYKPYGEVTVQQNTSFGDRDGDGDVDSTDKGAPGFICTGTVSGACRVLDLDFDGDYDSADATLFDALPQGVARHPGRIATATDQPFAHQGLLFEPELGSYQNRARQYDPAKRRFVQRDPLALDFSLARLSRLNVICRLAKQIGCNHGVASPRHSGILQSVVASCGSEEIPANEYLFDNLYVSSFLNPVLRVDPTGLIPPAAHNPNIPNDGPFTQGGGEGECGPRAHPLVSNRYYRSCL